jgi:hypothetical protein
MLDNFSWFLPLFNTTVDHANMPMLDYFEANILQTAEVSDAAKSHIALLNEIGIDPEDWRDNLSKPVLHEAVLKNYMKLAQWLVDQGVPVQDNNHYRCAKLTFANLSCLPAYTETGGRGRARGDGSNASSLCLLEFQDLHLIGDCSSCWIRRRNSTLSIKMKLGCLSSTTGRKCAGSYWNSWRLS